MNDFPVLCRPALPKDTDDVLELVSHIWDGHDYIPYVWQDWLADPLGVLAVAEMGGRIVGLAKLSCLATDDWFMEGLRVHPGHREQGIASRLNGYIVEYWRRHYSGTVRLATHNENVKVHHLCERSGFHKILEVIPYAAPILNETTQDFVLASIEELSEVTETAHHAPILSLSAGLIDLGWRWARFKADHLQEAFKTNQVYWWRKRQGVLACWLDEEDEDSRLQIQLVVCSVEHLAELLLDFRRLAAQLGKEQAGWAAPAHPQVLEALERSGFERGWDKSLYIFELGNISTG